MVDLEFEPRQVSFRGSCLPATCGFVATLALLPFGASCFFVVQVVLCVVG